MARSTATVNTAPGLKKLAQAQRERALRAAERQQTQMINGCLKGFARAAARHNLSAAQAVYGRQYLRHTLFGIMPDTEAEALAAAKAVQDASEDTLSRARWGFALACAKYEEVTGLPGQSEDWYQDMVAKAKAFLARSASQASSQPPRRVTLPERPTPQGASQIRQMASATT